MAVDAAELQRNPVRTNIAFLEHMNRDAEPAANLDCGPMVVPAITEQRHIRNAVFAHQRFEVLWPFIERSAVVDPVGKAPEQAIAAIEVDLVDRVPSFHQPLTEAAEQRPHQALEHHNGTFSGSGGKVRHPQKIAPSSHSEDSVLLDLVTDTKRRG